MNAVEDRRVEVHVMSEVEVNAHATANLLKEVAEVADEVDSASITADEAQKKLEDLEVTAAANMRGVLTEANEGAVVPVEAVAVAEADADANAVPLSQEDVLDLRQTEGQLRSETDEALESMHSEFVQRMGVVEKAREKEQQAHASTRIQSKARQRKARETVQIKREQSHAATRIQSRARSGKAKQVVQTKREQTHAATKIQSRARQGKAKEQVQIKREQSQAATKIQSRARQGKAKEAADAKRKAKEATEFAI